MEQWKKDRAVLPRIKVEKAAIEKETQDISPSMAAFYVDEIHLEGLPEELDFLNDKVHAYEKQKLSMNDIEKLVRILNQKLQDKGYVTTQVVIPEQNISAGTLHLYVCPVNCIRSSTARTVRNFPGRTHSPSGTETS